MEKSEKKILLACGIGFLAVLGLWKLKKFLDEKNYSSEYNDFHRNFNAKPHEDDHYGIEFLALS